MQQRHRTIFGRMTPLAASLLVLCEGSAASAFQAPGRLFTPAVPAVLHVSPQASTIVVQNCNDAGNGSLRAAFVAAQSGDTIDVSQLSCTKITLTTGEISVVPDSVTVTGPGPNLLSIDGDSANNHFNRVFEHFGLGTLAINHVTVTNAKYVGSTIPTGGCIRSQGVVSLTDSIVTNCILQTSSNSSRAQGGGIFAKGVTLLHSKVTGNFASSASGAGGAEGGGVYCEGNLTMKYSTVSNNFAFDGTQLEGGGIFVNSGNVYLRNSTVSGNYSGSTYGGIYVSDYAGTHTARIIDSTISGNQALQVAGLFSNAATTIANSTIAFNASSNGSSGAGFRFVPSHGTALILQSTIIANNSNNGSDSDADIDPATTVSGGNNLVVQHLGPLPAGTMSSCPKIGPLGNQGGETQTHRLLLGSPAVDAGNNVAFSLLYDQRGSGFPRTFGAQTDIGAFEDQGVTPNVIFIAGFEGRCR